MGGPTFTEPSATELQVVQLLTKTDILGDPKHDLARADELGFRRIQFRGIRGSNSYMSLVNLPVGEGCPTHVAMAEHLIVGIRGEIEFLSQGKKLLVGPLDQLFIPAREPYSYRNVTDGDAWFVAVIARADHWPPRPATGYDQSADTKK